MTEEEPSQFKLIYYEARGTADKTRLLLSLVDVFYLNTTISGRQVIKHQEHSPLGQLPIWEDDQVIVSGSLPVFLFLARKFHLEPPQPQDQALCLAVTAFTEEICQRLWDAPFLEEGISDHAAAQAKTKFMQAVLFPRLTLLSREIPSGSSTLLSDVSYADAALLAMLDAVDKELPLALSAFPSLKAYRKAMKERPAVVALEKSGRRY
eukprot:gnl/Dysnectes_brevis/6083_a9165_465.p1 GENE.gnl/Dysnectes_brevis/6083_a9165_465~~gnl/Dysnectes_brevis/6083_a9165_465.p1  ORF type:complete len:208 (-),score=34.95 gnl/Dysnectes_brevis/6083_a9165_465:32-655(-)